MKSALKLIYQLFPFKKQLFQIVKKVGVPSERIYQHLHFKGVIDVPIDSSHSFKMMHYGYIIENDIFWKGLTGGWERVSIDLWIKLSKRSNTIVDIGANTGIYSLISKCINNNARVYAFEPVERVYDKLVFNNQLNKYDIEMFKIAISNFTGQAKIYDTDSEHTYSVTVNLNRNLPDEKVMPVEISTITLDDFILNHHIKKIDLIKIDVETHEPEVLEGYKMHIKIHKPTILIEVLTDEIGAKIQEIVSELNYLYFNIGAVDGTRRVDKITQGDHFNFLLCDHNTASYLQLI